MAETSGSTTVSTKLERIAKLAREMPQAALTTLAHHIDIDWLREAYRRTRKDGATGVDRQTADEYANKLEENLREVLELGCRSGLLLHRIAPRCRQYVGLDLSGESLKSLTRKMQQLGGTWTGVRLLERSADSLGDLGEHSFDAVIINSVIQYVPHVEYLRKVLQGAIEQLTAGGVVFVGDVRSLPLLPAFASSVELYHAPATLPVEELHERIRRRISSQEELVLSPQFFLSLPSCCPRISRVEIRPKRGRFANEMTNFRYNVILHMSPVDEETLTPSWKDWNECKLTIAQIRNILNDEKPEVFAVKGVKKRQNRERHQGA